MIVRIAAAFAVLVLAVTPAAAQTAGSPPPAANTSSGNPTLRAMPDGPGQPVAELQGLD